jgi:hypothetical protein
MNDIHAVKHVLPERNQATPTEQQGVFRKFEVRRVDGSDQPGGKHHGCEYFVLDVEHDPHAKAALLAYANSCALTHPALAADMKSRYGLGDGSLLGWIDMQEWPPVRFKPGCVRADLEPLDGCAIYAGVPAAQAALNDAVVDAYLEDYEWYVEAADGREGFYQPNENEKAMIKDAIMGLPAAAK